MAISIFPFAQAIWNHSRLPFFKHTLHLIYQHILSGFIIQGTLSYLDYYKELSHPTASTLDLLYSSPHSTILKGVFKSEQQITLFPLFKIFRWFSKRKSQSPYNGLEVLHDLKQKPLLSPKYISCHSSSHPAPATWLKYMKCHPPSGSWHLLFLCLEWSSPRKTHIILHFLQISAQILPYQRGFLSFLSLVFSLLCFIFLHST